MKKLLSILMATLMLIGTFAVLPVSAGNTDTLDDHLITHWDFAGDNVLADKAPNGASSDTLSVANKQNTSFENGIVTLNADATTYLTAADSADFMRTPQITNAEDSGKYDRTVFIRFKLDYVDGKKFAYNTIMAQNGAFNLNYNNSNSDTTKHEIWACSSYLNTENRVFGKTKDGDIVPDGSAWMTYAITYKKVYDETNGASFEASIYTKLETGISTARKTVNASSTDAGLKYTANPNLQDDECPADCTGNDNHQNKLGNMFVIGANWHHKHMGNNFTLIVDDIRIYDKALTGDELLRVKASITNPLPTPGVVPPPVEDDSDTEQFTNVGHSLTLKGNTDINFYFKPVDGAQISDNAEAKLTNASGKQVDIMALSEIPVTDGTYKYSFGVAAKQMNETFTLTVTDGENTVYTNTYSIREYAKYIIDNASKYEAKLVDLVKTMLNYGAYSQISFNYDTENLANKDLNLGAPAAFTAKEGLGAKTNGAVNGITYNAATLVLNDATHVVFKFIVNGISNNDITVEGAKDYRFMAGILQVESDGLVASALDDEVSVKVTVGDESITVSYSPLAYIMNMADSTDANTQNLVRAMYAYHVAAEAYVA